MQQYSIHDTDKYIFIIVIGTLEVNNVWMLCMSTIILFHSFNQQLFYGKDILHKFLQFSS